MRRQNRAADALGRLPGWRIRPPSDDAVGGRSRGAIVREWIGRLTAAHVVASYPAMLAVTTAVDGWADAGDWFATAIAPVALPLIVAVNLGSDALIIPTGAGWTAVGLVYAAGSAAVLRTWHRRSLAGERRSAGRCPACGYDLRATPARCPECGVVPS